MIIARLSITGEHSTVMILKPGSLEIPSTDPIISTLFGRVLMISLANYENC